MIQFNLLPDVKLEYIKARRTKRLVMLVSIGLSALSVFVLLLSLVTVDVVQKKSLHDLNKDIAADNAQLKAIPDLDKILTVQNQLNTLPTLHDQKPVATRLFGYLSQLTPEGVSLSNLKLDFAQHTVVFSGAAQNLDQVNRFVDTLKNTDYAAYTPDSAGQKAATSDQDYFKAHNSYPKDSVATTGDAFSAVVLGSFGKSDKGATYTVNANFDEHLFDNTSTVTLRVPNGAVSNASALFQKAGS